MKEERLLKNMLYWPFWTVETEDGKNHEGIMPRRKGETSL
jgi:hypothetical protein